MSKSKSKEKYTVEAIGLAGIDKEFKLAHIPFLVVDDVFGALAFEGSSGTGKTTIVKRLGLLNQAAGGGPVGVFSADKARYEDFIGCPIPDEETGMMKMHPMPYSVSTMETLLVDEINRASYENQEKWLSLLATRLIDSTPVKCRYIYAAMNPILRDKNSQDTYEGVTPLDKALGERIMGLVQMPTFASLEPAHRIAILKLGANQAKWQPTEEAIEAHLSFLTKAREIYSDSREKLMDQVCEYIDSVQNTLKEETRGAITVEARRAQYMVFNVLSVFSLNKAYNLGSFELSALEALLMSFPNPLWEQPINPIQLKEAHNLHVNILKRSQTDRKKSILNWSALSQATDAVIAASVNKVSKEEFTKVVMNNWPAKENNVADHYIYAFAAVKALGYATGNRPKEQKLIKEEEFSRLRKVYDVFMDPTRYAKYRQVMEYVRQNKALPPDFQIPPFITDDPAFDTNGSKIMTQFTHMMGTEVGVTSMTQATSPDIEINCFTEFGTLSDKAQKTLLGFRNAAAKYEE